MGVARLLFWLRLSFLVDAAFAGMALLLLQAGEGAGWYLLVFAGLRAVLGVVALFWVAPHMIRGRERRAADPSR